MLFFSLYGFAEENCTVQWESGIKAYEEGRFDQAVFSFESCVELGIQNADLYYNLANAYFREGRIGYAILYYESALRLDPTNKDIQYNLNFARLKVRDKVGEEEENPILNAFFKLHHLFSLQDQLWFVAVFVWIIFGVVLLRVLAISPRVKNTCLGVSLVLGLLTFSIAVSAFYKAYIFETEKRAVVLLATTDVMSGPGDHYQTLNVLSEGSVMEVTNIQQGFLEIRLGEKVKGFVKISEVGLIK